MPVYGCLTQHHIDVHAQSQSGFCRKCHCQLALAPVERAGRCPPDGQMQHSRQRLENRLLHRRMHELERVADEVRTIPLPRQMGRDLPEQ